MTGRMSFALGTRASWSRCGGPSPSSPSATTSSTHARFVLVDPRGVQRVGFPLGEATPERLAHDMRLLDRGAVTSR